MKMGGEAFGKGKKVRAKLEKNQTFLRAEQRSRRRKGVLRKRIKEPVLLVH